MSWGSPRAAGRVRCGTARTTGSSAGPRWAASGGEPEDGIVKLQRAETIIALQKKVAEILEIPLSRIRLTDPVGGELLISPAIR